MLCVTIPAGVSVTETSRGGPAKHGAQLQSLLLGRVGVTSVHHLTLSCVNGSGLNTKYGAVV